MLVILLMTAAMTGCRTSKTPGYTGNLSTQAAATDDTRKLFDELASAYTGWQDLYVPVTLSLESPKNLSVSGRATLVNGKEINISLRMLGMEVAVLYADEQKVYLVDKFHKCYLEEDISSVLSGYDVTLSDLQNILLGRASLPGKGVVSDGDYDEFSFLAGDETWMLTPRHQYKGCDWHYVASLSSPPVLSALSLRLSGGGVALCGFAEPTDTPAGVVSGVLSVSVPYEKTDVRASVVWQLGDAKWNTGRSAKFKVPSSYKRLDARDLLKSIEKL